MLSKTVCPKEVVPEKGYSLDLDYLGTNRREDPALGMRCSKNDIDGMGSAEPFSRARMTGNRKGPSSKARNHFCAGGTTC